MKNILKITMITLVLFMMTGCTSLFGNKSYMKEISYKEYHKLLDNKETFVLEVMRTDCSACIDFKPRITEFANKNKIEIKYINTDHISEKEKDKLFDETGISGTPTVIFYNDGVEKTKSSRIGGSVSMEKIISKFKASGFLKEE